ncbi:MAG: flagellar hook-basal body complex protein FliE [Pseudomonadales bacterium]|nr:flagellar hook-basal body complex protein FliE [Pseudomonadales bacterium]
MSIENRTDIQNVLSQMRAMKLQSQAQAEMIRQDQPSVTEVGGPQKPTSFSDLMVNALDSVNELQQESGRLSTALERGDESVSLTQTMIASQKASVAFQAVSEVRNKLVNAYETIMNMPV